MKFLQDCALGYKVETWLLKLEVEISYIFHLELPLYYILNLICYYNMNETFKPFLNATFSIMPPLSKPITSNLIYICAFNKKDSKRHSDSDASAHLLPFRSRVLKVCPHNHVFHWLNKYFSTKLQPNCSGIFKLDLQSGPWPWLNSHARCWRLHRSQNKFDLEKHAYQNVQNCNNFCVDK